MINLFADAHGGTPVIQPLIDFFHWILIHIHDVLKDVPGSWGWSIIALTILVRACLLPLTFKQFHSMQRLAHLQPEMKKLQERFKNDKERMNQEMMKFYRENKVNPFASCLPMVAQFPVFISLYYMLRVDLRYDICPEINNGLAKPIPCGSSDASQFLFISDLTDKATGGTLAVLIILYVGSQLLSTLLMSTTTDRTQRLIFMALPFIFVLFVIQFPAGLLVYWITTNLWTIVQQAIIKKRLGPLRPALAEGEKPPSLMDSFRQASSTTSAAPAKKPKTQARGEEPKGKPAGPPPRSPRKKKKRSGRRR
ncbi:YidC/Oxa1 family membrane protein insertase [Solirubrobacter pauli]|uniref:Membrane protein insertase YidC n=1 Tax=Solirubrobacter pauli TaxID=166793 RepID=A0A660LF72_9ACTN|nr:YidC/Oxa1 family membrane protein insertase [Solirubrobacter pauli]RKQ92443.1 YidC/Oxa1 family membrane protein insertase [Solirubrobacter pauli]